MFICLKTAEVWRGSGEFLADSFLNGLTELLVDGDTLVVGSYNPSDDVEAWLAGESPQNELPTVYTTFFKLNAYKYPRGRSYELSFRTSILNRLVELSKYELGSKDRQLFFDHILAYRSNQPILPLFNFHDAFNGGDLFLSGLYTDVVVERFASKVGAVAKLEMNHEYAQD